MLEDKKIIVDCHLHALTREEFSTYTKTAKATKFINIRGLTIDEMLDPYDFEEFVDNNDMYFIDSVIMGFIFQHWLIYMQISHFFKNHAKLHLQFQHFKDSFLFLLVKGLNKKKVNIIKNIQT